MYLGTVDIQEKENIGMEVLDQSQGVFDDLGLGEGAKQGNKKNEDPNMHYYEDGKHNMLLVFVD